MKTKEPTLVTTVAGQTITINPNSTEPAMTRAAATLIAGGIVDALISAGLELSPVTEGSIHILVLGLTVTAAGWLIRRGVFSGRTAARLLQTDPHLSPIREIPQ